MVEALLLGTPRTTPVLQHMQLSEARLCAAEITFSVQQRKFALGGFGLFCFSKVAKCC